MRSGSLSFAILGAMLALVVFVSVAQAMDKRVQDDGVTYWQRYDKPGQESEVAFLRQAPPVRPCPGTLSPGQPP